MNPPFSSFPSPGFKVASFSFLTGLAMVPAALVPFFPAASAQILSEEYSTTFEDFSDGANYYSEDPFENSWFFFETPSIDSLPKFNPALGTLLEINITIEFDYSYDATITARDIIDEDETHGATMDTVNSLDFGLFYTPTGDNFLVDFMSDSEVAYVGFGGMESDSGPGGETSGSGNSFQDVRNVILDPYLLLSDFQGTGFVQGLRAGIFVPTTAVFELDNVTGADGFIFAGMQNGLITIEYVYQIPEPKVYALAFGVMAGILVWVRRKRPA